MFYYIAKTWFYMLNVTYHSQKRNVSVFYPSKHLLIFKTSWRCLQDMYWRRLQNIFSVTIFRFSRRLWKHLAKKSWRHLKDVLRTSQKTFEDVVETSWKRLGRLEIVTLKTSSRRLQDMSSRRLQDTSWRCLQDV